MTYFPTDLFRNRSISKWHNFRTYCFFESIIFGFKFGKGSLRKMKPFETRKTSKSITSKMKHLKKWVNLKNMNLFLETAYSEIDHLEMTLFKWLLFEVIFLNMILNFPCFEVTQFSKWPIFRNMTFSKRLWLIYHESWFSMSSQTF